MSKITNDKEAEDEQELEQEQEIICEKCREYHVAIYGKTDIDWWIEHCKKCETQGMDGELRSS